MNIDSIVSYAIFLSMVLAVIYFVSSTYPSFEYRYQVEELKFQKAISKYNLGENYEIVTKIKCIHLPNYFKNSDIEVNGNLVISNVSYSVNGTSIIINNTLTGTTIAYIYGTEICPNIVISDVIHGNKTSYSVTYIEDYEEGGIEFEKIYRRWL